MGNLNWHGIFRVPLILLITVVFWGTSTTVHGQNKLANGHMDKDQIDKEHADKGPVGWDIYRQLDRLPYMKNGVQTHQYSSYDRTGGNDDGFNGTYSCIEETDKGCVIAKHDGAGEVESIWFTREGGNVTKTGNIRVILDGKTVLDAPLQDVVNGKLGSPFVYPLVANADQSSGGVYIKIPMPFKKSMQIITDQNPLFYHVTYRSFSDSKGVDTFDPSDKALDVVEMLQKAGTKDPKKDGSATRESSDTFQLAPNKKITLANIDGAGMISQLRFKMPQIEGPEKGGRATDDGRAFGRNGSSEFTVKINPDNEGIRLTRRLDTSIGNQKARILVDGDAVGEWSGLSPTAGFQWFDQNIKIPASKTKGKSKITVRNEFISSDVDFNEFTYWIDSKVNGKWERTDTMDLGPDSRDQEASHDYTIVNQTWQGERTVQYPSKGDPDLISASNDVLQNTHLQIYFDGKLMVDSPLGEFFGSGLGESNVRSLMFAMDTSPEGWYSSWWPMPFGKSAKIILNNKSDHKIQNGKVQVNYTKSAHWAKALGPKGTAGYFRTTSQRNKTVPGINWDFLNTTGEGTVVGVTHTMEGKNPGRGYLEGDEMVYVDGASKPQIHGTGTEDFYAGGWYFNRGTFTNPLTGNPSHELSAFGCKNDCTGAYRLLIGDSIPFTQSIQFGIEHGAANDVSATYGSTVYWYKQANWDTTAPEITTKINGDVLQNETTVPDSKSVKFTWEVKDEESGVNHVSATFDGETYKKGTSVDLAGKSGKHQLSISAVDNAGNIKKKTYSINVTTSVAGMKTLVERYEKNGTIDNKVAHALNLQLITVEHFERKGSYDKAIKHLKGFKKLLDHQKNNELISEVAYNVFNTDAGYLIENYQ